MMHPKRPDFDPYKVGIPPGTRLVGLQRIERDGKRGWAVWTAIGNSKHNPSDWYGTFLFCCDDGSVTRVHVSEKGYDDELCIKGTDV